MKITDAQVHIYEPDTPEHPWPKEPGRGAPPQKHARGFSALEMLGAMEAVGVDRAVIVPPAWAGENNAPALAAAANYPGKFVVMGRIDPYAADSPERLERWLAQPNMRGIRMSGRWSTTGKQFYEALDDPALEWYWAACERLDIPIMILTGKYVSRLAPIAQRHPRLVMIIDHLSAQHADTVKEASGRTRKCSRLRASPAFTSRSAMRRTPRASPIRSTMFTITCAGFTKRSAPAGCYGKPTSRN